MQPVSKIYIKESISEHEAVAGTATPNQRGGPQTVGQVDYSHPPRMSSRAPASSALRSSRDETEAQYQLAKAYSNGEGVDQDFETAADLYRQAAEQGHAGAQYKLARAYYNGEGVDQDVEKAVGLYRQAAEQGHAKALFELAVVAHCNVDINEDYEKAADLYRQAAEQGHVEAQYELAGLYGSGVGVDQDRNLSLYWYHRAVELGHVDAQYELAETYRHCSVADRNLELAAKWYLKAAESGHLLAARDLADLYALGKGVEQDFKRALYWQMRHSLRKVMGTPVVGASLIDGSDEMISCLPDAWTGFQAFEFVSHLNLCNFRASDAGFSVIDRLVRFNSTLEWIGMRIPDNVDSGHVNATLKKLAESIRETIPTHRPPKLEFDQDEIDDSLLIEIDQLLGQNQAIFDLCRKLEKNPPVNSDELPPEVLKMLADQLIVRNIKDGQTKEATEAAVDEFLMSAQYQRLHQATGQFSSCSNSTNS